MSRSDGINEELLRVLGRHLASLSAVTTVQCFPVGKEDRVVAHVVEQYYPGHIEAGRLELRFRLNGDFNVQYIEEWDDEQWACRWDRHPNAHNAREHFHPPPSPQAGTAIDASYPSEPAAVLREIVATVETRINTLWTISDDPIYPAEYEFNGEYGETYLR